jgi:hypothetical protein
MTMKTLSVGKVIIGNALPSLSRWLADWQLLPGLSLSAGFPPRRMPPQKQRHSSRRKTNWVVVCYGS